MHEPMGFDRSQAGRSCAVLILEAETFAIPAGTGDSREQVGIYARAASFERENKCMQARYPVAETRRENLLEFEKRTHRRFFDSAYAALRGGPESEGDGDSLVVVQKQRRKVGARS
jgi:hypothetical protein